MNWVIKGFSIAKSAFPLDYSNAKKNPFVKGSTIYNGSYARILTPKQKICKTFEQAKELSLANQQLKVESNFGQTFRTLTRQIYTKVDHHALSCFFNSIDHYWAYRYEGATNYLKYYGGDICHWSVSINKIIQIVFEEYYRSLLATENTKGQDAIATLKKMKDTYMKKSLKSIGRNLQAFTIVSWKCCFKAFFWFL